MMSVDSQNLFKSSCQGLRGTTAFELAMTRLIGACRVGAAILLPLLAATPAHADIIRLADMWHGFVITQAQCAAISQAVWVSVGRRSFCVRYYLSTAGGEGSRPVVFLEGDSPWAGTADTHQDPPPELNIKDTNTDDLVKYADVISKEQKTTAIYVARLGKDGSSGDHHALRHTKLEVLATDAALEAIKRRSALRDSMSTDSQAGACCCPAFSSNEMTSLAPYLEAGLRYTQILTASNRGVPTQHSRSTIPPMVSPSSRGTVPREFSC